MTTFAQAVDHIISVLEAPQGDPDVLRSALSNVLRQSKDATPHQIEDAFRRLVVFIVESPPAPAALAALGCGALVENGADPEIPAVAILQRTQEILLLAAPFGRACVEQAHEANDEGALEDIDACVERYGPDVRDAMEEAAQAWSVMSMFCTAALAMLMRQPYQRRAWRQNSAFRAALQAEGFMDGYTFELRKLVNVLDDENIIVLHPGSRRGYRIVISGIGDNFQLHTLLADALIGAPEAGWLEGDRPDPLVVSLAKDGSLPDGERAPDVVGSFNLWNWQGLRSDGQLLDGYGHSDYWIWNEGVPADIELFQGTRVILLGPPPYSRSWNAGRYFTGMKGEVQVLEQLSREQVDTWLAKIAQAAPTHNDATHSEKTE